MGPARTLHWWACHDWVHWDCHYQMLRNLLTLVNRCAREFSALLVSLVAAQYALCNGRLVCVGAIGLVGRPAQDAHHRIQSSCSSNSVTGTQLLSIRAKWTVGNKKTHASRMRMDMSKACVSSYRNENYCSSFSIGANILQPLSPPSSHNRPMCKTRGCVQRIAH